MASFNRVVFFSNKQMRSGFPHEKIKHSLIVPNEQLVGGSNLLKYNLRLWNHLLCVITGGLPLPTLPSAAFWKERMDPGFRGW